jgi:hypothetical protein
MRADLIGLRERVRHYPCCVVTLWVRTRGRPHREGDGVSSHHHPWRHRCVEVDEAMGNGICVAR